MDLVAYFEIVNNLWVRNGLQIKGQAMTYVQCNFSNSMVDADVFMLQVCLTQLEPSTFIKAVLKNFRANEWLSLSPQKETNISTHDEHQIMMESFFHFLTLVICSRSLMRSSDEELLQLELQTLLCLGEKTHSQLVELMPERCTAGQSKDFVRELAEIADFREPVADSSGTLQHGIYTPKPTVWEDNFDPVHVMLRAIQKKDYQTAMDNFAKYTQQRYKIKNPWPPYRLPRPIKGPFFDPRILANSRIMHATIFTVLVHALKTQNFPEQVLAPAIFMIEIAVDQAQAESSSKQICQQFSPRPPRIYDLDQENWFVTDNILVNLKTCIEHVYIPEVVPEGTVSAVSDCQDTEMLAIDDAAKCQMAVVPAGYPLFGAGGELVPLTAMSVFNPPESKMMALEAAKSNQDMTIDLAESPFSEKEARALPGTENLKLVRVCENMLSILLKLQARASGKADSFNPNDCNPLAATEKPHPASESRIGEGAFHIEKLLHKICKLDPSCRDFIIKLKSKLCTEENLKKSREDDAKKERTFLAEKHRKKMLEELANNSQKFMKIVGEMEPPEEDMEFEEKTSNTNQCTCAICSKSSVSTDEAPMGLVALVQTTHALRFSKRANALLDSLPVSDEDCAALPKSMENNLAKDYDDRFKKLSSIFGSSCQLTMDMSGKGGVHVQTCGHHIHIQCLLEYLESLKASTNKPTNISIEKGEFMCPMCRQLSNTVLPMAVESGDSPPVLDLRRNSMASSAALVVMHLENTDISESKSAMDTAMQRAMQDVVNCSSETWEPPKLDEQTLMVMTHSTLRTTLEIQIAQLGDTLRMPEESDSAAVARRACLVPFMQVLSYCTKSVATSPAWPVWQKVSGVILMSMDLVRRTEREVPILLQNPTALLIHLLLLLPTRLDHSQFTCIIKALYNLQYFQCLLQLMCSLHIEDISNCCVEPPWDLRTLNGCISLLMSRLPHDCMLWHKTKRLLSARIYHLSDVEAELQKLCLPFLRVAALLRHDIYGQDLPQIHPGTGGFVQLVRFLELYQGGIGTFDAATALNWVAFDHEPGVQKRDPTDLVSGWCQELLALAVMYASATCDLVHHHKLWTKPCLLKLPPTYDQIFKHYHKRECTTCGKVPHELCLCLFCAKTICLKGTCCRQRRFEAVEHSMTCGGGTGIFLVVPSSYIIVIRASRACLWGSVYLDSHGEDDRDLKRGKPLYLSQPRMNLLEQQWLTHKFDHINKRGRAGKTYLS
ncbi:Hypothetical predicted protein [Cloeon dipterum]|uniref:E3 ubiquitin-protein ligase n=1 Tax=Cloeon dipterum TaxID=197152 RepID=A0A8S1CV87_9INSE|nr:Hypothetical predicted protein [Cloeon dipterum]